MNLKRTLFTAALGLVASASMAVDMYAVNWSGTSGAPATSSLYRVSSGSSTQTLIGDTGFTRLNSLSYDGTGGLVAWSSTVGQGVSINAATGVGTLLFTATGIGSDVRAIAVSGSTWYVIAQNSVDDLYRVDAGTGEATLIGTTGSTALQALDFDPVSGDLYAWDVDFGLGKVSTSTGAFSLVGSPTAPPTLQSIAFDSVGNLYGINTTGVYSIDKTTSATTKLTTGSLNDYRGAVVVPEPASMLMLSAGLAIVLRRRRKAA